MSGASSWTEPERLAALESYGLFGAPLEPTFQDLVDLAAELLDIPVVCITLVGEQRQWLVAEHGIGERDVPHGFCAVAVHTNSALEVPDAAADPRFGATPLVSSPPYLRFYAGELLTTPAGLPLGAFCVLDTTPHPGGLTGRQRRILRTLAAQVTAQLELRRALRDREDRIAAQHRDQFALLESESRLRALADAVPQIVWGATPAGEVDFANRRWFEYTGLSPGEPTSTGRFMSRLHPDDVAATAEIWRQVRAEPREFRHIYRLRRADGAYRWHLAVGSPHVDPASGALLRWFGGLVDVDAEHRAQAEVQRQVEQRTRERDQIWQASPDMLCTATLDGRFTAVSAAWSDALGWTAEELSAGPFSDFIHPDDRAATATVMDRLAENTPVFSFENRYRHRDGSYRWFSWNSVCHDGTIFATVRDVTAQREQAELQRRLEEQLRQAQKMEAVGQLTGGIAHDFNNLLAGIAGSLELMQRALAAGRLADLPRFVHTAQGAAGRAASLTQRLLAFSRRQTLDARATDANKLIEGMQDLIARTVGPAIDLQVTPTSGLWLTHCDPSQLDNALLNLAINARDAMPEGGRLTLATANATLDAATAQRYDSPPGDYVCVSVADTGTGMPPDVVARAFDPFFTTKQIGEGTGLGLSMIYGFARQSGGQVRIDSAPGQGTTVRIYLPRHFAQADASRAEPPVPSAFPRPSCTTAPPFCWSMTNRACAC
jgi:PAS domain S-box-containing protein